MLASPRTRRQSRKSLVQDANAALPMVINDVTSIDSLDEFVQLATLNSAIGLKIETFTIDLQEAESFSAAQLRAALLLIPNVQDLLLFLPTPVPSGLLADIRFRTLDFFATNIPHATLVPFLSDQSTLTSLVLGPCGRRSTTCPLALIAIPELMTLECTVECHDALPYPQVSTLTLDLPNSGGYMPTILRQMSQPASALSFSSLTLDFRPDDYDILDAITQAAPQVRKLKLVEKKTLMATRRDTPGRRPWNNRPGWHKALCSLPLLEELGIETLSPLITGEPGQQDEELRLVLFWAEGSARAGSMRHPHATLYHVMLRYGMQTPKTAALGHWYRIDGIWTRVVSAVGPAALEAE